MDTSPYLELAIQSDFSRDVEKAILTFSQALIFSLAIVISSQLLIITPGSPI